MGSSSALTQAIKIHDKAAFDFVILEEHDSMESVIAAEARLVDQAFIDRLDTYNIVLGGEFNSAGMLHVKGKKRYSNPLNGVSKYFVSGTEPAGWTRHGKDRPAPFKPYIGPDGIAKKVFREGSEPPGWVNAAGYKRPPIVKLPKWYEKPVIKSSW